jgi:hypothetical protein
MADLIAYRDPATELIDRKFEMRHMLVRFRLDRSCPKGV